MNTLLKNLRLAKATRAFCSDSKGNIALYMVFILPIALAFLIVGVEISAWQYLREEAQREADRIVLQAAQQLPYTDNVTNALIAAVGVFNQSRVGTAGGNLFIDTQQLDQSVSPSMVRLRVEGSQESSLDALMAAVTGNQVVFPVSQEASARLVPVDAVLIYSDTISLRPPVDPLNLADSPWGTDVDWPASPYFNFVIGPGADFALVPEPVAPVSWPLWWQPDQFNSPEYRRWATQLCYNPVLLPLKRTAMMISDTFSVSNENRLAIYASPGDLSGPLTPGYSELRSLAYQNDEAGRDRVNWSNYFEPATGSCDEACVYYGSTRFADANPYRIPVHGTATLSESACDSIIEIPPDGESHYPSPISSRLSACFRDNGGALLREAIYYRAARANGHEPGGANIARSFRAAVGALLEEDWVDRESSALIRTGLAPDSTKVVIIVSDSIPAAANADMDEALGYLAADQRMKVYLIGYNHQGLGNPAAAELVTNLATYEGLTGAVTYLADEDTLESLVRGILVTERKVVLSS